MKWEHGQYNAKNIIIIMMIFAQKLKRKKHCLKKTVYFSRCSNM